MQRDYTHPSLTGLDASKVMVGKRARAPVTKSRLSRSASVASNLREEHSPCLVLVAAAAVVAAAVALRRRSSSGAAAAPLLIATLSPSGCIAQVTAGIVHCNLR
jgi:hypothetical protein